MGRPDRPPGEIVPAVGPVNNLEALAHAAEEHRVFADDVAGPHRLDADLFVGARPDDAVAGIDPGLFQIPAQGVGDDLPIMQWLDVIRKIQAAGKGVVVDLSLDELEPFMAVMKPEGLYLCLAVEDPLQLDVLKRLEKW